MEFQGVEYSLVPSAVTSDRYFLVRVHLRRWPIVSEPLFNQYSTVCYPVIFLLQENTHG